MGGKTKAAFSHYALKGCVCTAALLALTWAVSNVQSSAVSEPYRALGARLLQFQSIKPASAAAILQQPENALSGCETDSQHALALIEVSVAESSLRSGSAVEFDRHLNAIESRSKYILRCSPRDSLAWLLLFGIDIEHGQLGARTFDFLAMSYETSPNEGWVAVRRITVAIPVILAAPVRLQQAILTEFEQLIRNRLIEMPARSYLSTTAPVRALLQARVDRLDANSRKLFTDTLERLRAS